MKLKKETLVWSLNVIFLAGFFLGLLTGGIKEKAKGKLENYNLGCGEAICKQMGYSSGYAETEPNKYYLELTCWGRNYTNKTNYKIGIFQGEVKK